MAYVDVFQRGDENLFKIGCTRGDVEKRRNDPSTGNPYPLTTFRVIEPDQDFTSGNFLFQNFSVFISRCVNSLVPI